MFYKLFYCLGNNINYNVIQQTVGQIDWMCFLFNIFFFFFDIWRRSFSAK